MTRSEPGGPIAIYVHTPFCPTKCGYCDFNSFALQGTIHERTVAAIVAEIGSSPIRGRPSKTIFFGGGTPTYLSEGQIVRLLDAVLEAHPPVNGCEITSEANPGTADAEKFRAMRAAGLNRLSLGAQSFDDAELKALDRAHSSEEIVRAVGLARDAGFENLNLDLMFALPEQTEARWAANLERAIAFEPEHLSLYCLTIEPNTRFHKLHHQGLLRVPDEDDQVAMYDHAVERAASAGYAQYEISNFAKPGFECRHNLCYWRGEEYAGYGPGAVGCIGEFRLEDSGLQSDGDERIVEGSSQALRIRYTNQKHPTRYCEAVEALSKGAAARGLWCDWETLDERTMRTERLMLGLRLNEGLPAAADNGSRSAFSENVCELASRGWISISDGRLRLTREGRKFCSEATLALID